MLALLHFCSFVHDDVVERSACGWATGAFSGVVSAVVGTHHAHLDTVVFIDVGCNFVVAIVNCCLDVAGCFGLFLWEYSPQSVTVLSSILCLTFTAMMATVLVYFFCSLLPSCVCYTVAGGFQCA